MAATLEVGQSLYGHKRTAVAFSQFSTYRSLVIRLRHTPRASVPFSLRRGGYTFATCHALLRKPSPVLSPGFWSFDQA